MPIRISPKSRLAAVGWAFLCCVPTLASAATGTWTGGAGASWTTSATNFSGVTGIPWNSANGPSNLALFDTVGATPVVSGTVFSNGITFSNTATVSGGTITLAGTTAVTANANATITSGLSGSSGLTKAGSSTLTLSGLASYTGLTTLNAGGLTIIGTGALTGGGDLTLSTSTASPTFTYTSSATSTLGIITLGTGSSRTASFSQSAGTIQASALNLATAQNSSGTYTLSGGTLALTGALGIGTRSGNNWYGVFNLTGTGVVTASSLNIAPVSTGGNSFGRMDLSGGTATIAGNLNLTSGAPSDSTGRLAICTLRGGQLNVNGVNTGTFSGNAYSAALLNFAGGTLAANAPNTDFISGITTAYIYGGNGARVDTNGNDITLSKNLQGTSANGVTSVSSIVGGSGYPASRVNLPVTFSAPGTSPGRNAQGYAITNSSGVVTGITVTDPGTGYSVAPSITSIGGGGTGAGGTANLGLPTNITSTGGGLTKLGVGTLTLAGANTYTGPTAVESGTLRLTAGASITSSSALSVSGGATMDNSASLVLTQNLTLAEGASLRTSAAGAAFAPASSVTLTGDLSDGFTPVSFTAAAGSGLLRDGSTLRLELANLTNGTYTIATGSGASGTFAGVVLNGTAMTSSTTGYTLFSGGTQVQFIPAIQQLIISDDPDFLTLRTQLLSGLYSTSLNPASSMQNLLPDGTFSDLNYVITGDTQFDPQTALNRALTGLRAYRSVGNPSYLDPTLRIQINSILTDFAVKNYRSDNWWWHTIAVPGVLADILLLGPDCLAPADLATLIGYASEGLLDLTKSRATTPASTGANFMDIALTSFKTFVGARDTVSIEILRQLIEEEIAVLPQGTYTTDWRGEGIQADGSFHQHGPMFYTAGYGQSYINNSFRFIDLLKGGRFQISDRALNVLADYLLAGPLHMGIGTNFDYNSTGRYIARTNSYVGRSGQLGQINNLLAYPGVLRRDELTTALAERNGTAPPSRARHFWNSDYTTQTTQGVFIGVKGFSTRLKPMESINSENVLGYYLSSGSTAVMRTGNEYLNIFPLWNWEKIPGTTALENSLNRSDVKSRVGNSYSWLGSTSFVGGVSDGRNAAGTMDQQLPMLSSRKSWFLFDSGFIGVGEGIVRTPTDPLLNVSNPGKITTAIEQRFLNGTVTVRDSAGVRTLGTGTHLLNSASWVLHDGIGYVFAPGSIVRLKLGPVSGNWNTISLETASTPVSGDVFLLWLDHGTALAPAAAGSYGYTTLVNSNATSLDAFVAAPTVSVLEATPARHLAWDSTNRLLQAVFRTAGTITTPTGLSLRVSAPCILMARDKVGGGLLLAVSNPLNQAANVVVDVDRQPLAPGGVWNSTAPSFSFALPGGLHAGSSVVFDTDANPLRNASLSVSADGQTQVVFAPQASRALLWSGQGSIWNVGGAANWNNNADVFYQGDTVSFTDAGTTKALTMNGDLAPGGVVTFNNSSGQNYVVSGPGRLTGAMAITKTGAGQVTLGGENTYSGDTLLSNGTLMIGQAANLGAPAARLVLDGGTLAINGTSLTSLDALGRTVVLNPNRPLGWNIATANHTFTVGLSHTLGSGGLTKTGPGTLVLTAPGNYTGNTVLTQGTLRLLGDQSAVNSTLQIGITNASTTALLLGDAAQATPTVLALTSGKSIQLGQNGYAGSATAGITVAGAPLFGTTVTNASPLNIYRSSTVTIGAGSTWQQSGNLAFRAVGGYSATLLVNAGGRFTYTGTNAIDLGFNSAANDSGSSRVSIVGGEFVTARAFQLTATVNTSGAAVVELSSGGTLQLSGNVPALTTGGNDGDNFRLGAGGGVIDTNGFSTALNIPISGAGGLRKTGTGTLTTTAANTYQGDTTVSAGTLALGTAGLNDLATVSISSGAFLALNFSGTDPIGGLTLGGVPLAAGTYSATTHPAFLTGTGQLVVVSAIVPPGFASWASSLGLSGDPAADFDRDSTPDVIEFIFGTDPKITNPSPVTSQHAGDQLIITFPRADSAETPDISLVVESGTNLSTWPLIYQIGATTAASSGGVTVTENEGNADTISVAIPLGSDPSRYARIKAVVTP